MRAAVLLDAKPTLEIQQIADPQPGAGEAVVRLRAAALNHRDVWILKGQYPGIRYPAILGSDGAGVVAAVGPDVDPSWKDAPVILNPSLHWGPSERVQSPEFQILGMPARGTFAEKILIPAANLVRKPEHLSFIEAAALPLAALTAFRALFIRAKLVAGETVLITGIGGGAAIYGLQLAVAAGGKVFVTSSSEEKIERARKLGAAGGALYTDRQWPAHLREASGGGFDVIMDSAGGPGFQHLVDVAKPGGRIAFFGATRGNVPEFDVRKTFWNQLSILGSTMGSPMDFAAMVQFVGNHQIAPLVSEIFPLEQVREALSHMEAGKQCGKIVLKMDS